MADMKLATNAMRKQAKATRKSFRGDSSPWAAAMRRSSWWIDEMADLIDAGEFDKIARVGE